MQSLANKFTDALSVGNVVAQPDAVQIVHLLASLHLVQGSTPLDVRARLLDTDAVQGIDRNAMYIHTQWTEESDQGGQQPVNAVLKVTLHTVQSVRMSLVIHYGQGMFQKSPMTAQSRFRWLAWLNPGDIKDILIAGGRELGLLPTTEYIRNHRLILSYYGYHRVQAETKFPGQRLSLMTFQY